MSNIEHLFENALSWVENGWNMSEFGKDKVNHELLGYVDASKEEIAGIGSKLMMEGIRTVAEFGNRCD